MKVGDLVECHRGERGLILDIEKLYPNHPGSSPIRNVLIHWLDDPPLWHVVGRPTHAGAVKRVISRASR
mgnify:CR=1